MEKLNIAMISIHSCPWDRPGGRYTGGMNVYVKELSLELGKRGHSVDVYTCSHTGHGHGSITEIEPNIRLIHLDTTYNSCSSEAELNPFINAIVKEIDAHGIKHNLNYDIIHSHYWISGLTGNMLKRRWHVPHITMFHTLGAIKNEAGLGRLEPEFRIDREKNIVMNADGIVVSTKRETQALVDLYGAAGGKIITIPCGVNFDLFRPMEQKRARELCGLDSKKVILFIGRADPLKGLKNLLEAITLLKHRDDFELVIVGGDDGQDNYMCSLANNCRQPDFQKKINVIGPVNHKDMYIYYNSADFCVIPSFYESFSLVAIESLACGTPVMATDLGGIRDLSPCSMACLIIEDNSPQTLAVNIDRILDLTGKTIRKQNFNGYIPHFYGWSHIADRVLSAYDSTISNRREYDMAVTQACTLCPTVSGTM